MDNRNESIAPIIDHYECVLATLEEIRAPEKSETGTISNGLASVMQNFSFYFSLKLLQLFSQKQKH
jgi:hypothetical protein